jgi:hypothetical protein
MKHYPPPPNPTPTPQAKGDAMIGFQPLGPRRPNFFRLVFANAWSTTAQMVDEMLERMDGYGRQVGLSLGGEIWGRVRAGVRCVQCLCENCGGWSCAALTRWKLSSAPAKQQAALTPRTNSSQSPHTRIL